MAALEPEVIVTSYDVIGTICPPSFILIASIFSELRGGGRISPPPVPEDQKKPGLNRVKYIFAEKKPGYLTSFVPLLRGIPRNTKFLGEFKFADCRFFCVLRE